MTSKDYANIDEWKADEIIMRSLYTAQKNEPTFKVLNYFRLGKTSTFIVKQNNEVLTIHVQLALEKKVPKLPTYKNRIAKYGN